MSWEGSARRGDMGRRAEAQRGVATGGGGSDPGAQQVHRSSAEIQAWRQSCFASLGEIIFNHVCNIFRSRSSIAMEGKSDLIRVASPCASLEAESHGGQL